MAVLTGGRFTLGLGAGERLNEHVVGGGWPAARVRHERLAEAAEIIRALLDGDYVSYSGRHFQVERAKLYDLPDARLPIAMAASGPSSVAIAGRHADCMIATQPLADLVAGFGKAGGAGKPAYGQLNVCYGEDKAEALERAREQWRWAASGWFAMSELPDPRAFDAASAQVTPGDLTSLVSCGPDVGEHVAAARQFIDAGFTHLAIVQVGGDQQDAFISWAARELLPALRELG